MYVPMVEKVLVALVGLLLEKLGLQFVVHGLEELTPQLEHCLTARHGLGVALCFILVPESSKETLCGLLRTHLHVI